MRNVCRAVTVLHAETSWQFGCYIADEHRLLGDIYVRLNFDQPDYPRIPVGES